MCSILKIQTRLSIVDMWYYFHHRFKVLSNRKLNLNSKKAINCAIACSLSGLGNTKAERILDSSVSGRFTLFPYVRFEG